MKQRLPVWFKQNIPDKETLSLKGLLAEFGLHTVCQEARCPNIVNCFKRKKATFMILGTACTRNCAFCGVTKSAGAPATDPEDEAHRISEAVKEMGLKYAVITSVTRDDLSDGGSGVFSRTVKAIKDANKDVKVEVLIPDLAGSAESLKRVLDAQPDVLAHNIETVKRLYPEVRPKADYRLSLDILAKAKELNPGVFTKSSLMLGLGETGAEVIEAMHDLAGSGCDILTLGQYLAPSPNHYPVKEFVSIEEFERLRNIGLAAGFKAVLSGPLVRSSYKAEEVFEEIKSA
ncbi:MAG: lipoyl synthase [Candidatus Omnitrophica bacterium]|nr:lipoyl synthase [Candidatus Omnitrophota bacterium]